MKECTDDQMRSRYRKMRVNGKQVSVHRYVMEQIINRKLEKGEIVHHINGNRYDNRPENLQLITAKEHSHVHEKERAMSLETKEKISQSLIGNKRRKGILHTPEKKAQIGQSVKDARAKKFWSTKKKNQLSAATPHAGRAEPGMSTARAE